MKNQLLDFECKNLNLKLGNKNIFTDFSYHFRGPGVVLIEGENGSGKSTLLKVFAGFILADHCQIQFSGLATSEIAMKDFSFFSASSLGLLNDLTGREHIHLVSQMMRLAPNVAQSKIREFQTLEIFNEILDKKIADYSQGMKQLLRLFLHLYFEPRVLFLDEPFQYLSPKLKEFISREIEFLASRHLVFVTDQSFVWKPEAKNDKIILDSR